MIFRIVQTERVLVMERPVPGTAGINSMAAVSQELPWPLCRPTCARWASWLDFSYPGSAFLFASFDDR